PLTNRRGYPCGFLDHPARQGANCARLLEQADELRGRHGADAGCRPARERLGADDRAAADVDLRLEVRGQALRAGLAEQTDELHVGAELERVAPLDPRLSRDHRMTERGLRTANELARVAAVASALDAARMNSRP